MSSAPPSSSYTSRSDTRDLAAESLAPHRDGLALSIRAIWSLALLTLCAAMYPLERSGWTEGWVTTSQVLALILTVGWLRAFFISAQGVVLTSFFQVYSMAGLMVSVIIISAGTFMIEVGRFGTANGAFWILMAYLVGGLEASRAGWKLADRIRWGSGRMRPSDRLQKFIIAIFTGATIFLSAYVIIRSGGPLLRGVDRVTFWRTLAPPGTGIVPSLVGQTVFFAIFYYLWMRGTDKSTRLAVGIILIYLAIAVFVLGEKFSAFIIFSNSAALIAPAFFPHIRIRLRMIVAGLSAFAIIISYIIFSYVSEGRDPDFALTRAALQSQLMWSVFDEPDGISLWPANAACYFGCGTLQTGREFISFRYLPVDLFYRYGDAGNAVSGFMPALSILTFGIAPSATLHLAVTFIMGFLQRKVVRALGRPDIIYGFLLFKLHYGLMFMWYVSTFAPFRGLLATAALIIAYRLMFPRHQMPERKPVAL